MRSVMSGIIMLMGIWILTGCSNDSSTPAGSDISAKNSTVVHEGESVKIIHSMMELNYASMTVADFNSSIQTLCEDAGTNVFEVISDAYAHFSVYNESGEFVYIMFSDSDLEEFMQTTFSYSAQEIFGEPSHLALTRKFKTLELF